MVVGQNRPCPNPACGVTMPLMRTFQISTKAGNQYWTKPVVNRETKQLLSQRKTIQVAYQPWER